MVNAFFFRRHLRRFFERQFNILAAPFSAALCFGVINQDSSHGLRGDGEKVRAALPVDISPVNQLQIRFVNQRGGLQGMSLPFLSQKTRGLPMQFRINERQKFIQRFLLAVAPFAQHLRDVRRLSFALVHDSRL